MGMTSWVKWAPGKVSKSPAGWVEGLLVDDGAYQLHLTAEGDASSGRDARNGDPVAQIPRYSAPPYLTTI